MKRFYVVVGLMAGLAGVARSAELPKTVLGKPGALLASEGFAQALPRATGSTAHFASGFKGWRYNVAARGGTWEVKDGTFRGVENVAVSHPATASIGFDFTNVVIECEVRLDDVPLAGRKARGFAIRTTDTKDYVCSIFLTPTGMRIQKDDNDHGGPDKGVLLGELKTPIKLGEWQKLTFEILGDEMVGTLNGQSLRGKHALIASAKRSVMFVSSGEGRVRGLRVWELVE